MQRVLELVAEVTIRYPKDKFFANFRRSLATNKAKRSYYLTYERAFLHLDPLSWKALKGKALAHFRHHRDGQHKQGFFSQLSDAFAYRYLVRRGFADVRILREDGRTKPDIAYRSKGKQQFCEVKTINISTSEIERRSSGKYEDRGCYQQLGTGFLGKLASDLRVAQRQIEAQGATGIIFILVHFDDFTFDHYSSYRSQLCGFVRQCGYDEVYLKVGTQGHRHVYHRHPSPIGA
jgi:hypothetical protein